MLIFRSLLGLLVLLITGNPSQTLGQGFSMQNFTVDVFINSAGYFDVVENYDVIFHEPKHGLYRDIVTRFDYQDEKGKTSKREIYITDINVPGRTFDVSGANHIFSSGKTRIKIGDKNSLVEGAQHYEIRYRVKNALLFTDSMVQLYWNLKPAGWTTVFQTGRFTVHGPEGSLLSSDNCFVYAGNQGDSTKSDKFDYIYAGSSFTASSKPAFISVPGQYVTVLVKLPRSLVAAVDFTPPFWRRHALSAVLLLLLGSLTVWIIHRIRSSKINPITSYYPPDNLDPAMAGALIDNMTSPRDISCLLPYWATKGIIRMEAIQKSEKSLREDLTLIKIKDLPADAGGYEQNLFQNIFLDGYRPVVRVSSIRGIFTEPLQLLKNKSKDYYPKRRRWVAGTILILSIVWAFFSITLLPFLVKDQVDIENGHFIAFIIVNFLFFFLIFPFGVGYITVRYRKKTKLGQQLTAELLGFRHFIRLAALPRIKELLKYDPDYYEKTMPYAVAFNLLKDWSAKFEGLGLSAPNWYSTTSQSSKSFKGFSQAFNTSMAVASTAIVVAASAGRSSSNGGGSSGGGAGSGGGGSW